MSTKREIAGEKWRNEGHAFEMENVHLQKKRKTDEALNSQPQEEAQAHNSSQVSVCIPADIWEYILCKYLSSSDIASFFRVCKSFYSLNHNQMVWKALCEDEYRHILKTPMWEKGPSPGKTWKDLFQLCRKESIRLQYVRLKEGYTPLQAACFLGHHRLVERLIKHRNADFDIDQPTHTATAVGQTPLFIACNKGHKLVVDTLIKSGAKVNAAEFTLHATPMYTAAFSGYEEVVHILIAAGADVNISSKESHTPIYVSAQNGHTNTVIALIQEGHADINKPHTNGATPLFIASQNGRTAVVKALVDAGANINAARQDGATPLLMAAKNGHAEVVRILLQHGADKSILWNNTKTALQIAIGRGHKEIVAMLQEELLKQ